MHITLGNWFKKYLFYPLLRSSFCLKIRKENRKTHPYISKTIPEVISLLCTWFLIGLWHGADWSYVVYGLYHGFFIISSKVLSPFYSKIEKKNPKIIQSNIYKCFQVLRTFVIVTIGYVIFRPANLYITKNIMINMISSIGLRPTLHFSKANMKELIKVINGIVILLFIEIRFYRSKTNEICFDKLHYWERQLMYVILLLLIIFTGAYGETALNQFAYFRF